LREASAPNFLSDIVRAERDRMSGFLLRWGQGWHIPEVMIDRPNIRVMIVRGTPLTAFIENVLGIEPTLDQSHNVQSVLDLPPDVVANRFRRFLPGYQQHMAWLDDQENKGLRLKPKGWMANIDFTKPTDNWHETLAAFLGIELIPERWREDTSVWSSERLKLNDGHAEIAEMLVKGGIRQDIIDMFLSHPKSIPYNCEEFLR